MNGQPARWIAGSTEPKVPGCCHSIRSALPRSLTGRTRRRAGPAGPTPSRNSPGTTDRVRSPAPRGRPRDQARAARRRRAAPAPARAAAPCTRVPQPAHAGEHGGLGTLDVDLDEQPAPGPIAQRGPASSSRCCGTFDPAQDRRASARSSCSRGDCAQGRAHVALGRDLEHRPRRRGAPIAIGGATSQRGIGGGPLGQAAADLRDGLDRQDRAAASRPRADAPRTGPRLAPTSITASIAWRSQRERRAGRRGP